MSFRILFSLLIMSFAVLPSMEACAQDRHPLTAEDLWGFRRVGGLEVSPDGRMALVVVTDYDIKANKGNGDIWLVPMDGNAPRQFTTGKTTESQAVWSPDGRRIAFVAKRDDNERPQLYLIDVSGGEARQITDLPLGASSPMWFSDGKRIAVCSETLPQYGGAFDSLKAELKRRKESKVSALATENRVVRYWDHYMTDGLVTHIYSVDAETKKITDLTPGMDRLFSISGGADYDLSPDGKELVVTALTYGPPYASIWSDIYTLPTDGSGKMKNLTASNPADDMGARYTSDGRFILFGQQRDTLKNAERTRLMRLDRQTGETSEVCLNFDRSPSDWLAGDDSHTVYFLAEDRAKVSIFSVPMLGGAVTEVYRGGTNSNLRMAGARLAFLHQNISTPVEVHTVGTDGGNARALTTFNDEERARIDMGRVEDLRYAGADGDSVQMYVVYPPGFDPKKKWPMVVLLHGGPHGTFGDDFHPRWNHQLFAAPGFVAIAPNFHGSTSFGERFAECINGAHPEKPFVDVMAAVDFMLARGYIDSTRIAAGGGSYGGYLTNWIGGHTSRFACLIDHAGPYNLMAQFASDVTAGRDISYGGSPWKGNESVLKWSPSQYAANWRTPTLVMHGEKDYRVPYSQGLELYGVLSAKGVPARIVVYPDENHWVLQPQNSINWYGEVHAWMKRWCMR